MNSSVPKTVGHRAAAHVPDRRSLCSAGPGACRYLRFPIPEKATFGTLRRHIYHMYDDYVRMVCYVL
jgi:hypothetical protein